MVNNCLIGSRTNHPGTNHHDRLMRVVEEEIDALFDDLAEKHYYFIENRWKDAPAGFRIC